MLFELKNSGANHYRTIKIENIVCVPHCHTSYELLFVTGGKIRAVVDSVSYTVSENSGIMITPLQIHSYKTLGDSKVEILIFSRDYITDFYAETKNKALKNPIFSFDADDLRLLQKSKNRYQIKSLLYKYCVSLADNGFKKAENSNDSLFTKIVIYTQENFRNNISLHTMAKELGYSYNYLSAYFKPHFLCGFSEYVNKLRIDDSAYQLKNTDRPVTDIAYSSGFTSIRRFNDVFKSEYRLTPTQYRKNEKAPY